MTQEKKDFNYWKGTIDPIYYETLKMIHPGKNIEQAIKEAYGHLIADELRFINSQPADFKRLVNSWLTTMRFPKQFQKPVVKLVDLRKL